MTIVFALRSTPVHSLRPRFMAHTSRVSVLRRTSSMACRRPRLFRPPKTCHWRCCSWRCCCPGDVRSGQCASGHLDHGNIIYIYYMYICWLCLCVWLCLAIEIVLPPLWDAKKSSSKHFYGSGSSSPKEWPFDLSPRGESILFAVPPVPCFFFWQHESIPIIWCASALDAWRDMDESYGGGEEQSQEISNGAKRHRSYCANKYKEQTQCLCSISQICCLKNI